MSGAWNPPDGLSDQNRTTADGPNPAVAAGLGPATDCMSFTWAIATLGAADVDTRVGTTGSLWRR